MTNSPEAKRPCLWTNCSGSGSGSNFFRHDSVVSISPDDTASLTQPNPAPADLSSSVVSLFLTDNTSSTSDNIESALHKIGGTKKYTTNEIIKALKDLYRWASDDNDRRVFCNEFLELGGISRILKFLMVPSNMSYMEYANLVGAIISNCTYPGQNGEYIDIALVMAKKFAERGAIHTMLLARAKEEYTGGSDAMKLRAVYSIWHAIGNISCHKTAFDEIEKDKKLNLFDHALATLRLLDGEINEPDVPHIKRQILKVLAHLIHPNSKLVDGDYKGRNVFQTCIDTMKETNGLWYFNEKVWIPASRLFCRCFNQNLLSTENIDDLKLVIHFFVEFIKKAPNDAFKEKAFSFLHRAIDVIGKEEMAKTPGLTSTLGAILDPSSNNNNIIEAVTENAAKVFVKQLF
jgi:hypothetical protein